MGQTTRSQGISFTHDMWDRIGARCSELKVGRSQYFQMLVDWDLAYLPEIHAHKGDGKWHFYSEKATTGPRIQVLAAEEPSPVQRPRRRRR